MSQSTIFQSCRDGATASWVINQSFLGVKCLAQGHNTAAVGFEPLTSCSGVRHSTTEPLRSPDFYCILNPIFTCNFLPLPWYHNEPDEEYSNDGWNDRENKRPVQRYLVEMKYWKEINEVQL